MIPILCHGCGQRGKVASLVDLACLECRTAAHLDLDEGQQVTAGIFGEEHGGSSEGKCNRCKHDGGVHKGEDRKCTSCDCDGFELSLGKNAASVMDASNPMPLLPSGIPEQDRDVALLSESDAARKVSVPAGSAPYTQTALGPVKASLALLTERLVATNPHRTPDSLARQATLIAATPLFEDGLDAGFTAALASKRPVQPSDPAAREGTLVGYALGSKMSPGGQAKVRAITAGILASNPGMALPLAQRTARLTVERYPKVAAGA